MTRSDELREFLATRRARITPQQAGLLRGHRRVAGLRREEVATLTGVSSEYYNCLERGNAGGSPTPCWSPSPGHCSSTTPNEPTCTT